MSGAGYTLIEAASVDQLAADIAGTPRLVILDTVGAQASAWCQTIKDAYPDVFVVQIDAAAQSGLPTPAVAACIDAFLADPIDARELLTLVGSLLRLHQAERRLKDSERRLELAQESAGLAILDWDILTNSFVHSAVFAELFDLPPRMDGEPFASSALLERIHPEDMSALLGNLALKNQTARRFEWEFRIIRRDGEVRWVSSRGRYFHGVSGFVERMISLSFDITERKESDRVNAQLASIVASSIDAIVSVDLANVVTTWNTGAERLFGFTTAEMIGRPLDDVLVYDDEATRLDQRRKLILGESSVFETRQTTRSGASVDVSVNSAPMRGSNAAVIGASLIMRDIAPQKRREDHVRFLMRELTHRSKNLLAVIQAMARQSLSKDVSPEEFVKRFSNRLGGLAGSHDLLSSLDWKGASLVDLIRSQLRHYEDLFQSRIILDGIDIIIRPEAAQNIGIALHELSTNAAKYGALSSQAGQVTVAWQIDDTGIGPRRLTMTWRETHGPAVVAPTRKGFGHIVMDKIAGQALNGKSGTEFAADGVVWTLDVPAASVVYE
ncbi:PAS domain S-box protein [Beijerinckia sp. L45]|uniref:PAS domain S-box protein n=1 Tax=Beijerinckia sp. L45 TaxID=1641855 RepID=UPI00131BBC77|nr:sensor histidine kinase [Beijerinckia sp. L45]